MKLKLQYTCLSRDVGQCNLRQVKGERPPCPACRFNKCVSLGMSLDGTILLYSMSTLIFNTCQKRITPCSHLTSAFTFFFDLCRYLQTLSMNTIICCHRTISVTYAHGLGYNYKVQCTVICIMYVCELLYM